MSPSAQSPANAAVSGVIAAAKSAGGCSGRIKSLAWSSVKCRSYDTISPAHNRRMAIAASCRRSLRTSFDGHGSPVMCSFENRPLPSATQNRPGYMSPIVAAACAITAGLYRPTGEVTTPNVSSVA
jgi:hypothetical protein